MIIFTHFNINVDLNKTITISVIILIKTLFSK